MVGSMSHNVIWWIRCCCRAFSIEECIRFCLPGCYAICWAALKLKVRGAARWNMWFCVIWLWWPPCKGAIVVGPVECPPPLLRLHIAVFTVICPPDRLLNLHISFQCPTMATFIAQINNDGNCSYFAWNVSQTFAFHTSMKAYDEAWIKWIVPEFCFHIFGSIVLVCGIPDFGQS